jgi:hypothetical protein
MATPEQNALVLEYIQLHPCCTKTQIAEGTGLALEEVWSAVSILQHALSQVEECEDEGQYRTPRPHKQPPHTRRQ